MSFYKNINCEIKRWEPDTYYPKGSLVSFDNMIGEVQSIYGNGFGFWSEVECMKRCILYNFCQKFIDKPGQSRNSTKCAPLYRDDKDSIYFKKIV